jgi:hypothetical protein
MQPRFTALAKGLSDNLMLDKVEYLLDEYFGSEKPKKLKIPVAAYFSKLGFATNNVKL